jgi:hypothetical protein
MLKQLILIGLLLLTTSLSAAGLEITVGFKQGAPDAKEFILSAKRAFYRRNYVTSASAHGTVTGVYKGQIKMEMILTDNGVIIRNLDPSGYKDNKIKGYLKNLERDLVYELAEYML